MRRGSRLWLAAGHGALGVPWPIILVFLCCVLPLGWLVGQLALNPQVWVEMGLEPHRWRLLGRTLGYNAAVAVLAVLLGLPGALVLGRGRSWGARLLAVVLPLCLLLPSLAYAYGWSQFTHLAEEPMGRLALALPEGMRGWWGSAGLRLLHDPADPHTHPRLIVLAAEGADVFRCIWTLAAWLWAVPAGVIGLALRRVDTQLQQAALLDGVLWRVTFRQLLLPIFASAAMVMVLALQEFAVWEPSGISVVATEVRMVFETGAFSSPDNPISAPMGVTGAAGGSLAARSGAAVAVAAPLLLVIAVLALVALRAGRRLGIESEALEAGAWPRALDAPWPMVVLAALVVLLTVGVPATALLLSLRRQIQPLVLWQTYSPHIAGSLSVGLAAGLIAVGLAMSSTVRRYAPWLVVAVLAFLVGGQLLAIGLIRVYNRPWLGWLYNGPAILVLAYLARFSWLALLAGRSTHQGAWRGLRDLAAVDGADAGQVGRLVIAPVFWPLAAGAGVLVMVLSMSEVAATVLLGSPRPPMLIPLMMTWVHMLRYDDMILLSLLLMALTTALGAVGVALWSWAKREARFQKSEDRSRRTIFLCCFGLLTSVSCLLLPGCGHGQKPEAIWCETGVGPGQVVYPRAIAYSPGDDTFFLVDRQARIQHLDHQGRYLNEWRMPQFGSGKPVGISVGPDGNVYVPDTHYQRVCVYTPKGELLRQWGSYGTGPGEFIYPTDIAFDEKGRVFVSEYGDNDRIQVFDRAGTFLYQFGHFGQGDGEFARPQSMVIAGDLVYVTDACNHRLVVFKTDGTFVKNIGSVGSELGQFRFPYGLDRDAAGNLVVCEFGNNRVQLVDPITGRGLRTWGDSGREPGQLAYPWALALDRRGRVVTVDAGNNRLQVFEF